MSVDIPRDMNENEEIDTITLNPPMKYFRRNGVPDIGELMLASFPDSDKFLDSINVSNPWWMGEKYDGVRICWNPIQQQLFTRSGSELKLAQELYDLFPYAFVDGETWFGRDTFAESQQLIHSSPEQLNWSNFRVVLFDDISENLQSAKFEDRYKSLLANIKYEHPFIISIFYIFLSVFFFYSVNVNAPRILCTNKNLVHFTLKSILEDGGEGVIMRKRHSLFENGRSRSLVKLKASRWDKEAMVIDIGDDDSILLKLPDGNTLELPPQNVQLSETRILQKGDIVTISFDSHSRSLDSHSLSLSPSLPLITRVRTDLSWAHVLHDFSVEAASAALENKINTHEERRKARIFLEEFARERGLDPLNPETWYKISRKTIEEAKGGQYILNGLKGGYVRGLMSVFYDVEFEESKFDAMALKGHRDGISARRQKLISIASDMLLDPLTPECWYKIAMDSSTSNKAKSALQFYSGSLYDAVSHLFPEIQLDSAKFIDVSRGMKSSLAAHRVVNNSTCKAFGLVMSHYDNNLQKALLELFPNITIEKKPWNKNISRDDVEAKVSHTTNNTEDYSNSIRRLFFENFAKRNGFDPLLASNWYSVTREKVLRAKGAGKILYFYNNSLAKALVHLFPSIGLEESQFCQMPSKFWLDVNNRRKLFERIAGEIGFGVLQADKWQHYYSQAFSISCNSVCECRNQRLI